MKVMTLLESLHSLRVCPEAGGSSWHRCHELCGENEGLSVYDWAQALLHRIEDDLPNARYWYGRAGRIPFKGRTEGELIEVIREIESKALMQAGGNRV